MKVISFMDMWGDGTKRDVVESFVGAFLDFRTDSHIINREGANPVKRRTS